MEGTSNGELSLEQKVEQLWGDVYGGALPHGNGLRHEIKELRGAVVGALQEERIGREHIGKLLADINTRLLGIETQLAQLTQPQKETA